MFNHSIMSDYSNMRFNFYTPSEIVAILGERLKTQRLALNLTQATLAKKADTGISTVARIESGQGGTLDNVIRLAIALGMINHFAELFENVPANIEEVIAKQNPRLRASNKGGESRYVSHDIYYRGANVLTK